MKINFFLVLISIVFFSSPANVFASNSMIDGPEGQRYNVLECIEDECRNVSMSSEQVLKDLKIGLKETDAYKDAFLYEFQVINASIQSANERESRLKEEEVEILKLESDDIRLLNKVSDETVERRDEWQIEKKFVSIWKASLEEEEAKIEKQLEMIESHRELIVKWIKTISTEI